MDENAAETTETDPRLKYRCRGCGHQSDEKWFVGPCPGCGRRYDREVNRKESNPNQANLATLLVTTKPKVYVPTGIHEFDKVIGGGFVQGSTLLIGGPRGVGKTTILLQIADNVAHKRGGTMYVSSEQNNEDIVDVARKIEMKRADRLRVYGNEPDIFKVVEEHCDEEKPFLLIVDSIQTVHAQDVNASEGTSSQVEACANYLTSYGKEKKVCVVLVCHVNSMGDFKGGQSLQHLVDTLVFMTAVEQDNDGNLTLVDSDQSDLRQISIYGKNRNASGSIVGAKALMEMTEKGLQPVEQHRRRSRFKIR